MELPTDSQRVTKNPLYFGETPKYPSTFDDGSRDWSQVQLTPEGLSSPAQLPNLAAALSGRGYSDDDTRKVLGGNWLRLFEQVWQ